MEPLVEWSFSHLSLSWSPLDLTTREHLAAVLISSYISHLSIPKYYISRGITRIFSLPEGYKGKYDPYFPPSGYYFDQSEPMF